MHTAWAVTGCNWPLNLCSSLPRNRGQPDHELSAVNWHPDPLPGQRPLSGMVTQDHASSWSSWAGIGCPAQDDLPGSCYGPALYKPGL